MSRQAESYEQTQHRVDWTDGTTVWVSNFTCDATLAEFVGRMADDIISVNTRIY